MSDETVEVHGLKIQPNRFAGTYSPEPSAEVPDEQVKTDTKAEEAVPQNVDVPPADAGKPAKA